MQLRLFQQTALEVKFEWIGLYLSWASSDLRVGCLPHHDTSRNGKLHEFIQICKSFPCEARPCFLAHPGQFHIQSEQDCIDPNRQAGRHSCAAKSKSQRVDERVIAIAIWPQPPIFTLASIMRSTSRRNCLVRFRSFWSLRKSFSLSPAANKIHEQLPAAGHEAAIRDRWVLLCSIVYVNKASCLLSYFCPWSCRCALSIWLRSYENLTYGVSVLTTGNGRREQCFFRNTIVMRLKYGRWTSISNIS